MGPHDPPKPQKGWCGWKASLLAGREGSLSRALPPTHLAFAGGGTSEQTLRDKARSACVLGVGGKVAALRNVKPHLDMFDPAQK